MITQQHGILKNGLSKVKLTITDEITMILSILFFQLHQRLTENFGCSN